MRNVKDILRCLPGLSLEGLLGDVHLQVTGDSGCFHLMDAKDPAPDSFLLHSTRVTGSLV